MIQTKSRNEMQLTQSLSKLKRLKRYAITYVIKKYDQESFVTDVFVDFRMISRTLGTWSKTFCSEDIPFCMAFYRLSKLMWADREKKNQFQKRNMPHAASASWVGISCILHTFVTHLSWNWWYVSVSKVKIFSHFDFQVFYTEPSERIVHSSMFCLMQSIVWKIFWLFNKTLISIRWRK